MSQDLIGRPLVPFFDADENVNESLQVDPTTQCCEPLDVDARVWDKERGYFVYPNEQQQSGQTKPIPSTRPTQTSTPIAITPRNNGNTHARAADRNPPTPTPNGSSPLLLTPDMLSRSAPDGFRAPPTMTLSSVAPLPTTDSTRSPPRSSSAKRASRSRNTPRRSHKQQGTTATSKNASPEPVTETRSAPGLTKKHRTKQNGASKGKDKEKWAWSAFQSSPDPKLLPLPPAPFVSAETEGHTIPPPMPMPDPKPTSPQDGSQVRERLDPPPSIPPLPPDHETPQAMSIEVSMTHDLRRMLNIGG